MSVNYNKLWKLLIDRNMTKTQMRLAVGLSTVTHAGMNKGGKIWNSTVDRICKYIECSRTDIMEDEDNISKFRDT